MEFVLQGVQTVAVTGAGAKLGDVEAGSVGHVDHESVGEDHEVVLLREEGETDTNAVTGLFSPTQLKGY